MNTAHADPTYISDRAKEELIYPLYAQPPVRESIFAALQHVLAIFVPIITPPLILANALELPPAETRDLVSMSLFISGIATFIQVKKIGAVGTGMLNIQGTSFTFLSSLIAVGKTGGLPLIFGICMAGSFVEIGLSRCIPFLRKITTPLISGIIVALIGISLIGAGISNCAGGGAAQVANSFGAFHHLALALFTLGIIVVLNRSKNRFIRMGAIIIGITAGYIVSIWTHDVSFASCTEVPAVSAPIPLKYGVDFNVSLFVPVALLYVVTAMESFGDITATSLVSGQPIHGEKYEKRIAGGILGDGINSFLASLFCTLPNTTFSQNNGIIQLTGVASRYIGYFIAGLLIFLGLFPPVAEFFALMPAPVLGGATLLMFGTVAAAGIRLIASTTIARRDIIIIAVSFGLGIGVIVQPDVLNNFPEWFRNIFSSGIVTGGIAAVICHLILPHHTTE